MYFLTTNPGTPTTLPPNFSTLPSIKIEYAYALQDPNNPSQVSALAIIVQPSGRAATAFTHGRIAISICTPEVSYINVYNTSDFANTSTFNNTYGANFTNYQAVAPNCSIIELNGNGDQILEPGETFSIFLNLNSTCLNCPLSAYQQFTVELIPSTGAKLTYTGNMPANITPVMNLLGSN